MRTFLLIILNFFLFYPFIAFAADCAKPTMPSDQEWEKWLNEVKIEASKIGISKKTINNAFTNNVIIRVLIYLQQGNLKCTNLTVY